MSKKECSLIQNLLNDYINSSVSDDAEDVIKEHLEKCKDCNSLYMQMKSDNAQSKEQEVRSHKEYLKKFNKKLSLLKKIIIVLLIIILIIFVPLVIKLIHNNYILDSAYNKLQSIQDRNNECWIDKETMMNVRNVMNTQNENTQQYSDSKLLYVEDKEISDTDVELPELEGFTVNNK